MPSTLRRVETLRIKSEKDLQVVARVLAPGFAIGQIVALEGPLGAGKTTLVRALCRALGVPREIGIRSPTFTLVNELEGDRLPIVHADFYRIMEDPEALAELGFVELCTDALAFVEWGADLPEVAEHVSAMFTLAFVEDDEEARTLQIAVDPTLESRWKPLLAAARDSL